MRTNEEIITIIEERTKEKGMSLSELARQVCQGYLAYPMFMKCFFKLTIIFAIIIEFHIITSPQLYEHSFVVASDKGCALCTNIK